MVKSLLLLSNPPPNAKQVPTASLVLRDCHATMFTQTHALTGHTRKWVDGCKSPTCSNRLCRTEYVRKRSKPHRERLEYLAKSVGDTGIGHYVLMVPVMLRPYLTGDDLSELRRRGVKALRSGVAPEHRTNLPICATMHPAGAGAWMPHVDAWMVPVAPGIGQGMHCAVPFDAKAVRASWQSALARMAKARGLDPASLKRASVYTRTHLLGDPLMHAMWRDMRSFPQWHSELPKRALTVQTYGLLRGLEVPKSGSDDLYELRSSEVGDEVEPMSYDPWLFFPELSPAYQTKTVQALAKTWNGLTPDEQDAPDNNSKRGNKTWHNAGPNEVLWWAHRVHRASTDAEIIAGLGDDSATPDPHVKSCATCARMVRAIRSRDYALHRARRSYHARWEYLRHLLIYVLGLGDAGACPMFGTGAETSKQRKKLDEAIKAFDNLGIVLGDATLTVHAPEKRGTAHDRLSDWAEVNPTLVLL